jgi:YrbI family 3-deoxy-D-manno-octulosonate 8-phosphate phosphatase
VLERVPQIVALIPLRGGSKRIPRKNIKPMGGMPLAYWVCLAASRSRHISRMYVSTDCPEIAATVAEFGLGVNVLMRPPHLSGDGTPTEAVMLDLMERVEHFDILATIQATSPLTSERELDSAIALMLEGNLDSVVTGTAMKRFVWTPDGTPLNYDFRNRPFTQNFAGSVVENGAFYLTRRELLARDRCRLGGRVGVYTMPEWQYTELDDPDDWPLVEKVLSKHQRWLPERLQRVKVIFSDFDGVWTDNTVFVDDSGRESVRFSKDDSLGLSVFREQHNIPVIVVSKERNPIIAVRCNKSCLPVLQAIDDKPSAIASRIAEMDMGWDDVCYIGNDVNDIPCMKLAALSVCTSDAAPEVLPVVDIVLSRPGGGGAIRQLFEIFGDSNHG